MLRWKAVIKGLPQTCWEGGVFHFAIEFPQGYPFKPFKLWLETKMHHPNVAAQRGGACSANEFAQNLATEMLSRWSPAHTVRKVLTEVSRVILSPNLEHPMEASTAQQYRLHTQEFEQTCRAHVQKYARKPPRGHSRHGSHGSHGSSDSDVSGTFG